MPTLRTALGLGALCLCVLACTGRARAQQQAAPAWVQRVELQGLGRTRADVLLELLPRAPPGSFASSELEAFERALNNLEIFDSVEVTLEHELLTVRVREKWTLIPSFDFASGTSLSDTYFALGVTEYNFLGTAGQLSVQLEHQQRGLGFYLTFKEHAYRLRRWAAALEAAHGLNETLFESPAGADEHGWTTRKTSVAAWLASPPFLHHSLRLQVGAVLTHETNTQTNGSYRPPNGAAAQGYLQLSWDGYQFHDLTPTGARVQLDTGPGLFLPAAQPRHYVQLTAITALPLGAASVWMTRTRVSLDSRGNPNSAAIVGSLEGVRGLADNVHHSWWAAYSNCELRSSWRLLERLALQAVVFADLAHFEPMRFDGGRGSALFALGTGAGLRVIPTFLAQLLLRFDVARLWAPEQLWFYQLGVSQYF